VIEKINAIKNVYTIKKTQKLKTKHKQIERSFSIFTDKQKSTTQLDIVFGMFYSK